MSRLTRNQEEFWGKGNYKGEKYIIVSDGVTSKQMCLNKLGKLEDLEEQIGCPLEVYVKLIQDTAIFDAKNRLYYVKGIVDNCGSYVVNTIWFNKQGEEIEHSFYLRDYKKLFWLKEDKSE
jgi:hypothetical protein